MIESAQIRLFMLSASSSFELGLFMQRFWTRIIYV